MEQAEFLAAQQQAEAQGAGYAVPDPGGGHRDVLRTQGSCWYLKTAGPWVPSAAARGSTLPYRTRWR